MKYNNEREIQSFIKNYLEEIQDGRAAIFAGAGLSVDVGVVSWKELLREAANEIGIDVDKEHDLVSVAQYIYNQSNSRNKITKLIKAHIQRNGNITENHKILANLPINTIWTTNYDEFIEKSFEEKNKIYDVKKNTIDLSSEVKNSEATIYKMHGDINRAHDAVLIKDDYEIYDKKNELFTQALKGDLISKTFLFIGFSFDDPNLENILSRVRIMLEGNTRTHFCFFKEVSIKDAGYQNITNEKEKEEAWKYDWNKQYHKIKDLERYGIKSILVKKYSDITKILKRIEKLYSNKNIFISGSFDDDKKFKISGEVDTFVEKLAIKLHEKGYKITTGFGKGIGSSIVLGVLRGSKNSGINSLDRNLDLWPFPLNITDAKLRKKEWRDYRKNMITNCGTAIFLLGNKLENGELKIADGVKKEFKIAREKELNLVPIGSSGYASKNLYEKMLRNFDNYYSGDNDNLYKHFKRLGKKNISIDETVENIVGFLEALNEYYYNN